MENRHPTFLLLRATPDGLLDSPPLASSLQSFETSLLLLALAREPHAMAAATFAVESALKAARRIPSGGEGAFETLLRDATRAIPALRHQSAALAGLRRRRNEVVHYGFSPEDDDVCASLLLRVALPALDAIYRHYFRFDVTEALFVELSHHLRVATEVELQLTPESSMSSSDALIAFRRFVGLRLADEAASYAQAEAALHAKERSLVFEEVSRRLEELERDLEPCWTFDCPACESVTCLVATLSEEGLDAREIQVVRALCAQCDLHIPSRARALTAALLRPQVEEHAAAILREYGR